MRKINCLIRKIVQKLSLKGSIYGQKKYSFRTVILLGIVSFYKKDKEKAAREHGLNKVAGICAPAVGARCLCGSLPGTARSFLYRAPTSANLE